MRIGVLGGGQLARMLALAGIPLGERFAFYGRSLEPVVRALWTWGDAHRTRLHLAAKQLQVRAA